MLCGAGDISVCVSVQLIKCICVSLPLSCQRHFPRHSNLSTIEKINFSILLLPQSFCHRPSPGVQYQIKSTGWAGIILIIGDCLPYIASCTRILQVCAQPEHCVLQMGAPAAAKNCCVAATEAVATQTKWFSTKGNKSVVFVSEPFC